MLRFFLGIVLSCCLSCSPLAAQETELDKAVEAFSAGDTAAVPVLKRLASQGNPTAEYTLAEAYYRGFGVPQDYSRAARLYEAAANQNIMNAQQNIAVMYVEGKGVRQDFSRALFWFRKAAAQGDSFAQYSIGLRYVNGQGVEQNYAEALSWFRKAAQNGYIRAFHDIGMLYAQGLGVPQDYSQAVAYTRRAAEAGYPPAQYNLGVAYGRGQGVRVDLVEAYKWFQLAAIGSGDENGPGAQARESIAARMTKGQLRDGEQAVAHWRQEHSSASEVPQRLKQKGSCDSRFCWASIRTHTSI